MGSGRGFSRSGGCSSGCRIWMSMVSFITTTTATATTAHSATPHDPFNKWLQ